MARRKVTATSCSVVMSLPGRYFALVGLFASLVVAPTLASEIAFTKRAITTQAFRGSIFAVDLDKDGDIDIVGANRGCKISWYENDGGMSPDFTAHVISPTVACQLFVYVEDVDGDGDIDVLSASSDDDTIRWYENQGGSPLGFTEHVITTSARGVQSVFAMDVDGDGDIDVLSASFDDDKIAWYENQGGSPISFTEHVISTAADGARSVYAADVDGDGDTDVLSASQWDNKIAWYENHGGSPVSFTEHVISTTAEGAQFVYAVDLDSDGDTDVVSTSDTIFIPKLAWHENDGGSPPSFTERVISTGRVFSVVAADIDGDGDSDLLSGGNALVRGGGALKWYQSNGDEQPDFTTRLIWGVEAVSAPLAADMDGDGDLDVVVVSLEGDGYTIAWYENRPCADAVVEASAPDPPSHAGQTKNRFLSIVPDSADHPTALRVTLTSSTTFPGDVGKQWWVGSPREICENSGQGIIFVPGNCGPAPGIPKTTFWSSELVCDQRWHHWRSFIDVAGNPLEVLHISDPDIVPGSVYDITAVNHLCDPSNPDNYSTPLQVWTSEWGDTSGLSVADCPASGPNGLPISLILDCASILQKFSNSPCAPLKSRVDLGPSEPNLTIQISDVLDCLHAFTGGAYPFPGPVGCP